MLLCIGYVDCSLKIDTDNRSEDKMNSSLTRLLSVILSTIVGISLFVSEAEAGHHKQKSDLAYFGDYDSDKVFVIDLNAMQIKETIATENGPYGVDQQDNHTAYALTRKVYSMDVIDTKTLTSQGIIVLPFTPRSTDYNKESKTSLVSGKSDPMSCLIDIKTHEVGQCVGDFHDGSEMTDFGGGNATGHPFWIDKRHFFLLDRVGRSINYYGVDGQLFDTIDTETTVHHLLEDNKQNYYAVLEGSKTKAPGIIKFKIEGKQFKIIDVVHLTGNANIMGGHHADFHPNGQHIYMGSYEGNLFVIDKDTMQIVDTVIAGKGVGHVTFIPGRQLAITTNHYDTFMSVFDVSDPLNNTLVQEIEVAEASDSGRRMQSHTSGVRPDEKYFYSAASNDGMFFEIDLDTLKVGRKVIIKDANLLMGSFVWHKQGSTPDKRWGKPHKR